MKTKRLTKWIDDGEKRQAIPDPEIRSNGHGKCCNKLAELEDLEEQGRLLRLPCKKVTLCGSCVSAMTEFFEFSRWKSKLLLRSVNSFGQAVDAVCGTSMQKVIIPRCIRVSTISERLYFSQEKKQRTS